MEKQMNINGVNGRYWKIKNEGVRAPHCHDAQKWISESRPIEGFGNGALLRVEIRHDDGCKNGHNSFSITADVYIPGRRDVEACGCLHDEIATVFPELAHLIKLHLSSTDGPLHYVENTCYHAGDRDCHGLRKGEKRQIKNERTGKPCWELVAEIDGEDVPIRDLKNYVNSDTAPASPRVYYAPLCRVGEGKERDFEAARRAAVWPDATDEQLSPPRAELEALLIARLPQLLADFKRDVEAIGFEFLANESANG